MFQEAEAFSPWRLQDCSCHISSREVGAEASDEGESDSHHHFCFLTEQVNTLEVWLTPWSCWSPCRSPADHIWTHPVFSFLGKVAQWVFLTLAFKCRLLSSGSSSTSSVPCSVSQLCTSPLHNRCGLHGNTGRVMADFPWTEKIKAECEEAG